MRHKFPSSTIPTAPCSTSPGDTCDGCVTTSKSAAKHLREPRPLQTVLALKATYQMYFPACFHAEGFVHTKEALYLITHSLNHPCPLEWPISLGNESVWWYTSTHVAATCWDDGHLHKTLAGDSQERDHPCKERTKLFKGGKSFIPAPLARPSSMF